MAAADAILEGLDPEQRAVATATDGPVVVLAGAGTGKTRAITHRIAYAVATGAHESRRSLAVTFTTRAAGEMRGRLAALGAGGVQARTFHSAALRQLRYFWPLAVGGPVPEVLARKAPVVAAAASRARVPNEAAVVRDLAAEIEWAKVSGATPDSYADAARAAGRAAPAGLSPADVARVFAGYEDLREAQGRIDFEDVLLLTVGILADRPDVADQVRATYRWFTVDEYQDVNPLQQRLLLAWLGERDDVCVVGDAAQTIYSFAGATPDHLIGFRSRFPGATEVRLVRSYRCSPQVVATANRLLAAGRDPAVAGAALTLRSERPDGPAPVVRRHDDEPGEAVAVATEIASLVAAGTAPRDIAVLYRINAASAEFEAALAAVGVPYVMRGAERFFERGEVRHAVTLLRGAARAGPGTAPGTLADRVRDVLGGLGWSQQEPPAPGGAGAAREAWESLAALATLAEDLAATQPDAGMADLVAELDRRAEVAHVPVADGVTLASLHAAKGLEWDAVFIVGCVEGTLPIVYADTPARVEEERRLLYVGVTRARRVLHLSWAQARTPGQRGGRTPSRFLAELDPTSGAAVSASTPSVRRGAGGRGERRRSGPARCRVCGTALVTGREKTLGRCRGCPVDLDEALYEALREWRRDEAARQSVPAFVVFTDATLQAVAERRPTDDAGLVAIDGIGPAKLARYGAALLAVVRGDATE